MPLCSDFSYKQQGAFVAKTATDSVSGFRYKERMSRAPRYKTPPANPMNQWVRDAMAYADVTQTTLAEALTRKGVGSYDRSIIQKMTVSRRVTMEEASAISEITGYPYVADENGQKFILEFRSLDEKDQGVVRDLIRSLRSREERSSDEERAAGRSREAS